MLIMHLCLLGTRTDLACGTLNKGVVDQLPPQALSQAARNLTTPAAIFARNGHGTHLIDGSELFVHDRFLLSWNISSERHCRCALMILAFKLLRRLTTRTKNILLLRLAERAWMQSVAGRNKITLRSAERRKTALHFLQEGTQLVLFFLGERGHELHDGVDTFWQDPLKEIKRCFGEFNAKHTSVFRMLIAFDQPRSLQAGE